MRALKNILWILHHGSSLGRLRLILTYLRISTRQIVSGRILRSRPRPESLFGQNLAFPDYDLFAVLFEEIYIPGAYEFRPLRADPQIVDCGANIGMSIAFFLTLYPGARITAFEAEPQTFGVLSENARRNSWDRVTLNRVALHRTDGVIPFFSYETGSLVSSFRREMSGAGFARSEPMATARLSSFINSRVDLLKLDIEGAELDVLEDLAETHTLQRIDQIIMEYHHHIVPGEDRLGRLLGILEDAGFGYDLRAPGQLPFSVGRPHNFMMYAYRKAAMR